MNRRGFLRSMFQAAVATVATRFLPMPAMAKPVAARDKTVADYAREIDAQGRVDRIVRTLNMPLPEVSWRQLKDDEFAAEMTRQWQQLFLYGRGPGEHVFRLVTKLPGAETPDDVRAWLDKCRDLIEERLSTAPPRQWFKLNTKLPEVNYGESPGMTALREAEARAHGAV